MLTQLIDVGYNKAVTNLTLSDRSEVISSILDFNLFIKVKAAMDQFREGLNSAGLLPTMKQYEDLLRPLFVDDGAVVRVGKWDHTLKNLCLAEMLCHQRMQALNIYVLRDA